MEKKLNKDLRNQKWCGLLPEASCKQGRGLDEDEACNNHANAMLRAIRNMTGEGTTGIFSGGNTLYKRAELILGAGLGHHNEKSNDKEELNPN